MTLIERNCFYVENYRREAFIIEAWRGKTKYLRYYKEFITAEKGDVFCMDEELGFSLNLKEIGDICFYSYDSLKFLVESDVFRTNENRRDLVDVLVEKKANEESLLYLYQQGFFSREAESSFKSMELKNYYKFIKTFEDKIDKISGEFTLELEDKENLYYDFINSFTEGTRSCKNYNKQLKSGLTENLLINAVKMIVEGSLEEDNEIEEKKSIEIRGGVLVPSNLVEQSKCCPIFRRSSGVIPL